MQALNNLWEPTYAEAIAALRAAREAKARSPTLGAYIRGYNLESGVGASCGIVNGLGFRV